MSGMITGLVMRTPVTKQFSRDVKFTALVYAEHAWPDGTHAYPAVETVADFIGCSVRSVQRYIRTLEEIGMLIPDGKGPRGTNSYKFLLENLPDGGARLIFQPPKQRGDNLSPRQIDGVTADSGDRDSGDTGVTRLIEPLLTTSTTSDDPRFGELVREMEKITGSINMATADFLDDLLADWRTYLEKLHPYHQDHAIDPYTAVLECIREAVASASGGRPNHKYIRAIFDRWMREGYKSKRSGDKDDAKKLPSGKAANGQNGPAGNRPSTGPAKTPSATVAERINARRRNRQNAGV